MYLAAIVLDTKRPPRARLEFEVSRSGGSPKREMRQLEVGDSLFAASKGLEEYRGISIAEIDPIRAMVTFTNGDTLEAGEASGNVNEDDIRRIQIRETINSHYHQQNPVPQRFHVRIWRQLACQTQTCVRGAGAGSSRGC